MEESPQPPTIIEQVTRMVIRDWIWLALTVILFGCIAYLAYFNTNHEQICDDRYENFVRSCYQAVGLLPDFNGYNNSLTLNVTFAQRWDGERWTTSPDSRK